MAEVVIDNVGSMFSYELAHPPPGEEIVISGLAGMFPDSHDANEFRENLFNKVDMVSDDNRRWAKFHEEIPQRSGKLYGVEKLDAGYFGIPFRHANCTDPMVRLILEKAVEAVIDAGINPNSLEGTNTGVYVGICSSETEKDLVFRNKLGESWALIGCMKSQEAQTISYHLKLNGPSFTCDTACSSSMYVLEEAYREMRLGKCDQAIVGGVNLCLFAHMTLQFARLGMLSPDGRLRAFDNDANGYVRSEAACAVLLQKAKSANRIYCRVVHAKVNSDGYKSEGITYPSGASQTLFLDEFYRECGVNPSTISFLEAHGTGTKVGDPEEVLAIASVFCKDRSDPLRMGGVKSNIGHSEPVSGLCSIAKIIFTMETGFIPPNINFKTPKREIEALHDGRISVVTEKQPWTDDNFLAGINNFGFGGANAHCLLAPNTKVKIDDGQPKDDLPRLVCVAGRTEQALNAIFEELRSRTLDAEFVRLFHEVYSADMRNEKYRGFSIVSKNGELMRSVDVCSKKRQICFVFDGSHREKWAKAGRDLLALPVFADAISRVQEILRGMEVKTVQNCKPKNVPLENFIASVTTQVGVIEILKIIGFVPDYVAGRNFGEFICAYCDGLLTLEQLLAATYHVGLSNAHFRTDTWRESNFDVINELSKIIASNQFEATKWMLNSKSEGKSLSDVLIQAAFGPDETGEAVEFSANPTHLVCFGTASTSIDSLIDLDASDCVLSLLTNIGRLYKNGANFQLSKLYPEIRWPVSRGTPMISPMVKWDYQNDWHISHGLDISSTKYFDVCVINTKYNDWAFLKGHVIDGSILFPAAGYLCLVWSFYAEKMWSKTEYMNVAFENIKFVRASNISRQDQISYTISILSNGDFEVS